MRDGGPILDPEAIPQDRREACLTTLYVFAGMTELTVAGFARIEGMYITEDGQHTLQVALARGWKPADENVSSVLAHFSKGQVTLDQFRVLLAEVRRRGQEQKSD